MATTEFVRSVQQRVADGDYDTKLNFMSPPGTPKEVATENKRLYREAQHRLNAEFKCDLCAEHNVTGALADSIYDLARNHSANRFELCDHFEELIPIAELAVTEFKAGKYKPFRDCLGRVY